MRSYREREADDWPTVPEPERCAVQMCPGQVLNDLQRNAVLGEESLWLDAAPLPMS